MFRVNASGNKLLWKGLMYEDTVGLYYVRNRWYDPDVGRFISEDPIGIEGGINMYVFGNDDPINYSDPSGLLACCSDDFDPWRDALQRPAIPGSGREALAQIGVLFSAAAIGLSAGVALEAIGSEAISEQVLFEGSKSSLRAALRNGSIRGVNARQANTLLKTLGEGTADVIRLVYDENGLVSYSTRAGRNGYQTLVRIFGQRGELEKMAQAAWDAAGRFVHGEVWR